MKRKLITTADGSHTFFVKELSEHYHSVHGAIQESQHVFIEAGFKEVTGRSELAILEIGFGTGLNAWLTIIANLEEKVGVRYTGIEAYPLTVHEAEHLNYPELLNMEEMRPALKLMHQCDWGNEVPVYKDFSLIKLRTELEHYSCAQAQFDLVYFDAFGPDVQPELWTEEVFDKLFSCMKANGVLVTYCAKGSVKRAMKTAGFTVENIPGPPEKGR